MREGLHRLASRPGRIAALGLIALLVIILDQLTKAWIVANIDGHTTRPLIEGFVRLRFTENTGAAFGLFQGWTGALSVAAIAIIAAIVLSATRTATHNLAMTIALGMVLGGAIGNLIDRLRLGYVVDFVEVYGPHIQIGNTIYIFPVFNVADSAITVGVVLIMALLLFGEHENTAPRTKNDEREQVLSAEQHN